jgi:hypothetical protein
MKMSNLQIGETGNYVGELVIANGAIRIRMAHKPNPVRLWFMRVFLDWEWRDNV